MNSYLDSTGQTELRFVTRLHHSWGQTHSKTEISAQCSEFERLEHNRLLTQELHANSERMKLLVLVHRSKVRDTRYYQVE